MLMDETITVIEEWSQNEMIRYVRNKDGTRTVLEHVTNAARPIVTVNRESYEMCERTQQVPVHIVNRMQENRETSE